MTNSEIFKAAHKMTKETVAKYNFCNYAVTFAACLKVLYATGSDEVIMDYSLNIPFADKKEQKRAKQYLSAKWNSISKCWEVKTSLKEIKECNLQSYLSKEIKKENKEMKRSKYADDFFKRGFDYAEEGTIGSCV